MWLFNLALLLFRVFTSSGFPESAHFGRLAVSVLAFSNQSLVQKLRITSSNGPMPEEGSGFHFRNFFFFFKF
jgi:hypothetical protein